MSICILKFISFIAGQTNPVYKKAGCAAATKIYA